MSRLTERFRKANERDRQFIMNLNLSFLNKVLLPLFAVFLCLDFLDVYSTLLAINTAFDFHELNPIASRLFAMRFNGFLIATAFKYLPAIPLFYMIFASDPSNRHPLQIRMMRFVALVALVAADAYLGYIVVWNNFPNLIAYVSQ